MIDSIRTISFKVLLQVQESLQLLFFFLSFIYFQGAAPGSRSRLNGKKEMDKGGRRLARRLLVRGRVRH